MFSVFLDEILLSSGMFLCMAISILGIISLGVLYQNMIKETENMRTTENKILKQCKLKYTNCYKVGNGVPNVSVFVDKYLGQLKMGPMTCRTFYHVSGQAMLLSVLFAGVAVCHRLIMGATVLSVFPYYIVCFLGLYLYFAISAIVDVKGKRRILKTNLVDYFENHMGSQMELEEPSDARSRQKIELMPVISKKNGKQSKEEGPKKEDTWAPLAASGSNYFSPLEQKELEELLKEFLTS